MTFNLWDYAALALTSFTVSFLATPLLRKFAIKVNALDKPNLARKSQVTPVPYFGGIAIATSITGISFLAIYISNFTHKSMWTAAAVLLPALIMTTVGLIDDLVMMSPTKKLLSQVVAALIVTYISIATNTVVLLELSKFGGIFITSFWIVGLINSVNFFDNHDGASSSLVAISCFYIFLIAMRNEQYFVSALAVVILGSLVGFYFWNMPNAKIYLGDSGSLYLGLLLATLTIRLKPSEVPLYISIFMAISLVGIFLLDSMIAVMSRLQRRISPATGGKDHISHRLMRSGLSKKKSLGAMQLIGMFLGAFSLLMLTTKSVVAVFLFILTFFSLFAYFYSQPHE
jgi:UDP-GlcNAc:undecaprenyl-phosphate GlcNAc-1-phosphate transferase